MIIVELRKIFLIPHFSPWPGILLYNLQMSVCLLSRFLDPYCAKTTQSNQNLTSQYHFMTNNFFKKKFRNRKWRHQGLKSQWKIKKNRHINPTKIFCRKCFFNFDPQTDPFLGRNWEFRPTSTRKFFKDSIRKWAKIWFEKNWKFCYF